MRYKIGDKIRVRDDLVEWEEYGCHAFVPQMREFKGEQTIKEVCRNGYTLMSDEQDFLWTDEMFENIESEEQMDNQNITVNMENLSEEERAALLDLIKKANKPESKVWKPKRNENYYCLKNDGGIIEDQYINHSIDKGRYEIDNCFKTKEEAEFASERQRVITELKRFALEHNDKIDWNNKNQYKYILFYSCCDNSIRIESWHSRRYHGIYFSSEEIAKAAIEQIGEERLKKYYFKVNE